MSDEQPVVSTTVTIDPHAMSQSAWEELWNVNTDDDIDLGSEIYSEAEPVELTEEQVGYLAVSCRSYAAEKQGGSADDKKWAIDLIEAAEYLEGLLPEPEGNTNCLEGLSCPECKSLGNFKIAVVKTVEMSDHGEVDESGDNEWDGPSRIECCECGHVATVADFTIEERGKSETPAEAGNIVRAGQMLWVSALTPRLGGDIYNGVRVQVSVSEKDAYDDLAEWLDESSPGEAPEVDRTSIKTITDALDESALINHWNVEEQTLYS